MTGIAWLVGVLRVRCWAEVNVSRHYHLMYLDSSHDLLHQPSPFACVCCLNTHLSPLLLSLWFISGWRFLCNCSFPFLPLHNELVSTVECRKCAKKNLNQQQHKRVRGAEVWPYCSPNKSPQILTDVKVQGRFVCCLLMEIRSMGTLLWRLPCTFHLLWSAAAVCVLQMLLLHSQWIALKLLKMCLHCNLPWGAVHRQENVYR